MPEHACTREGLFLRRPICRHERGQCASMLMTLCPKGILLACKVKSDIWPETSQHISTHERDTAVLLRAANGAFNAGLHGVAVGDHWLHNDIVATTEIHHFRRGESFCVVDSDIARGATSCGDVLFSNSIRVPLPRVLLGQVAQYSVPLSSNKTMCRFQRRHSSQTASLSPIHPKIRVGRRMGNVCL